MTQCKSYAKYKGIHKPKCDGGKGCEACWEKYKDEHPREFPEDYRIIKRCKNHRWATTTTLWNGPICNICGGMYLESGGMVYKSPSEPLKIFNQNLQ
jgi:hypothetical protein